MAPDSDQDVSPHVRLRIDPGQKKKWLDFINESDEYTTLTDLIKTSVHNTIESKWVLISDNQDENVPNELKGSIDKIDNRLNAIETQLDDFSLGGADPTEHNLNKQELMELGRRCHDNLIIVQNGEHLRDIKTIYDIKLPLDIQAKVSGTAQDISAYLNEPPDQVRNALIYLEHQEITNVESIIDNGTRRWFQKDPTVERNVPSRLELDDRIDEDIKFMSGTEAPRYDSE